jgi:predicted nucleic acid-binding protein
LKITKEIDINDAPFVAVYFAVRAEGIISYDKDFDKMGLKRYTSIDLIKNKLSL